MTHTQSPYDGSFVDAAFPLRGAQIPIDHGYPLLGAVARLVPAVHERAHWSLHPVFGQYQGKGVLALTRKSRLKIRLPAEEVSSILALAGKSIEVADNTLNTGFPQLYPLVTAPHLKARLVTIKGFDDAPEAFADALRRQIASLPGLNQDPERVQVQVGPRRVLRIKGTPIVGFAVALTGLDADGSLAIQKRGLGGRRHMGAGVFSPPPRSA
jgi:CRISPR-associated protein Cas6